MNVEKTKRLEKIASSIDMDTDFIPDVLPDQRESGMNTSKPTGTTAARKSCIRLQCRDRRFDLR